MKRPRHHPPLALAEAIVDQAVGFTNTTAAALVAEDARRCFTQIRDLLHRALTIEGMLICQRRKQLFVASGRRTTFELSVLAKQRLASVGSGGCRWIYLVVNRTTGDARRMSLS